MTSLATMYRSLPECSYSYDDYMHRVFLTTNEKGYAKVLQQLEHIKIKGNTIIGVSGLYTLNIAAKRLMMDYNNKIRNIIIIDRSDKTKFFWENISSIIKESPNKDIAMERILDNFWVNKRIYYTDDDQQSEKQASSWIISVLYEIQEDTSFLSTEESFNAIKKIFDQDGFQFLRLDFSEEETFQKFAQTYKQSKLETDTIYLSNVLEYLNFSEQDKALASLVNLVSYRSLIVDTKPREKEKQKLFQRMRRYRPNPSRRVKSLSSILRGDRTILHHSFGQNLLEDKTAKILFEMKFQIINCHKI